MYTVKSIEYADDINHESSESWYRYIISNEYNTITGVRSGTKSEVQKHARLCTILLNDKYKDGKTKTYKPANISNPVFV